MKLNWTDQDTKELLTLKDTVECDEVRVKEKIKEALLGNRFILHVLDNKELEENDAEPDDYFGVNILPYYYVPGTQSESKNFLCYECTCEPRSRWDSVTTEKYQRI